MSVGKLHKIRLDLQSFARTVFDPRSHLMSLCPLVSVTRNKHLLFAVESAEGERERISGNLSRRVDLSARRNAQRNEE